MDDNRNIIKISIAKPNHDWGENYIDMTTRRLFYPDMNVGNWPYQVYLMPYARPKYYIIRNSDGRFIPCYIYTTTPLFGNLNDSSTWAEDYVSIWDDRIVRFDNVGGIEGNNLFVAKNGKVATNHHDALNLGQKFVHFQNDLARNLNNKLNKIFYESATTTSVGDIQYDAPPFGDRETMKRHNGEGGSVSINHI